MSGERHERMNRIRDHVYPSGNGETDVPINGDPDRESAVPPESATPRQWARVGTPSAAALGRNARSHRLPQTVDRPRRIHRLRLARDPHGDGKTPIGAAFRRACFVDAASCLRSEREVAPAARTLSSGRRSPLRQGVSRTPLLLLRPARSSGSSPRRIRSRREPVVVCYGSGATLLRPGRSWDLVVYFDLTREEVLRRNRSWTGRKSRTQSISPRRIYYVDFPVHDRHRGPHAADRQSLRRRERSCCPEDPEQPGASAPWWTPSSARRCA